MSKPYLLNIKNVTQKLLAKYNNNKKSWLAGGGTWPLTVPLGMPTEQQAVDDLRAAQEWQQQWIKWSGDAEIEWVDRKWPELGTQRLPEKISFHEPRHVATAIGEAKRWDKAVERYKSATEMWPVLSGVINKHFEMLAEYSDDDFERFVSMLKWLQVHPESNLYIRQIPVYGIDTKWLETRTRIFQGLLKTIHPDRDNVADGDFYSFAGLRKLPVIIRMRILDHELRVMLGGASDVSMPIDEIARLKWPVEKVFIVENLQSGLSFSDISSAVVFMHRGYDVKVFGNVPWIGESRCFYWGDIDTHGFSILNRLRAHVPHARSLLMDDTTLMTYKALWVKEPDPETAEHLVHLTNEEHAVYDALRTNQMGNNIRLEQERIPWESAWITILQTEGPL